MKVSEDDMIEVDGEKINQKKKKIFIALTNQEGLCVQLMQELKKIILLIF